jgi:hypothetical protein
LLEQPGSSVDYPTVAAACFPSLYHSRMFPTATCAGSWTTTKLTMSSRETLSKAQEGAIYVGLLTVQTAAATFMFWVVFPLFRQMIARLGEPLELSLPVEVMIISSALALNCAYWARYRWITVRAPFHSVFLGHVVQFVSRTNFFFGGALFSAIFFRHLPELDAFPTIDQAVIKGLIVMWVLFALYCYSLELERLGKAIEEAPSRH